MSKASNAFNSLRRTIWYRKCISIDAKIRIFRACVLPVLLYGSELWCLTTTAEQHPNAFYMRCLRTIIGATIGDRMRNDLVLQLTGQPTLENILRRNRLRWFGHVNRMNDGSGLPRLPKKALYASFREGKRPPHGVKLRWRDKISTDLSTTNIRNWRREVYERDKWRKTINHDVKQKAVQSNVAHVVRQHKERAEKRREEEKASLTRTTTDASVSPPLLTAANNQISCDMCGKLCKGSRGLKIHQHSCRRKVAHGRTPDATQRVRKEVMTTKTCQPQRNLHTKITQLLRRSGREYICPTENCERSLKPQGATAHVKACAKAWLTEQGISV